MKKKNHKIKLRLKASKENVVNMLLGYDHYEYQTFVADINDNSTLLVLEYRSGFQNIYQSLTFVVSDLDTESDLIIYESRSTTSASNLLNVRKEIEKIIQFILNHNIEVINKEEL